MSLQMRQLRVQLGEQNEVVLVDDGIWSRGSLDTLTRCLESFGIHVVKTVVAVQRLPQGTEKTDDVISLWQPLPQHRIVDWVNERDFFLGVPFSGKVVGEIPTTQQFKTIDELTDVERLYSAVPLYGDMSAPYIQGLGDPVGWASIPASKARVFSRQCLSLSAHLYREIELLNTKARGAPVRILVKNLARPPYLWREPDMPVVEAIGALQEKLR